MTTYNKDSPDTIKKMFSSIAKRYDVTNSIMSLRMHKHWNARLVDIATEGKDPTTLLDLCSGTGDISFEYLKRADKKKHVILLDFCQEMLDCAKEKAVEQRYDAFHKIEYHTADAQLLPLDNQTVDGVTISYGIRNVKNPQACIKEVRRVLRPGGRFTILELTRPKNPLIKAGHLLYLKIFLPLLGKLLTKNKDAYQYLSQSIDHFVPPEQLERILAEEGFSNIKRYPLLWGTATIIRADV